VKKCLGLYQTKEYAMTELLRFNNQLHLFQNRIIKEAKKLDSDLAKRIEDKNNKLQDYEIELELSFYLKEDDKEYKRDDDNIIMVLKDCVTGINDDFYYEYRWGETNHNEFHLRNDPDNMKDEHHCWFYRCLYDHTELTWDDILRIGSFWMDIHVRYQYYADVDAESVLANKR